MFEQPTVENVMHPEVREYLEKHHESESALLHYLRELILSSGMGFSERLRWRIPCYDSNGMCLYLQVRKGLVEIGFVKGHLLEDPAGMLQHDNQRTIRHVRMHPEDEVPKEAILVLIAKAAQLNQQDSYSL